MEEVNGLVFDASVILLTTVQYVFVFLSTVGTTSCIKHYYTCSTTFNVRYTYFELLVLHTNTCNVIMRTTATLELVQ